MKLLEEALTVIQSSSKIVIALSGGVDSMVLLNLLYNMGEKNIICLHVNHGISDNSSLWEQFCKKQCEEKGIPLHVKHLNLKGISNLEEVAREERYKFFSEHLLSNDTLVLGHHLDDQAETFLLRALRGSGVDGLSCISPVRKFNDSLIARPLLGVTKDEIVQYAELNNIPFVYDESNSSSDYDRNFIRNEVLPLIKTRWENAPRAFSRVTDNCRSVKNYVDSKVNDELKRISSFNEDTGFSSLDVNEVYSSMSQAERFNIIRGWISSNNFKAPTKGQLLSLDKAIMDSRRSNTIDCDIEVHLSKNIKIKFFDNSLYLFDISRDNSVKYNHIYYLCNYHGAKKEHLSIIELSPKQKVKINNKSKSVKQILKENKIPKFLRKHYLGIMDTSTGNILSVGRILADKQKSNHHE